MNLPFKLARGLRIYHEARRVQTVREVSPGYWVRMEQDDLHPISSPASALIKWWHPEKPELSDVVAARHHLKQLRHESFELVKALKLVDTEKPSKMVRKLFIDQ